MLFHQRYYRILPTIVFPAPNLSSHKTIKNCYYAIKHVLHITSLLDLLRVYGKFSVECCIGWQLPLRNQLNEASYVERFTFTTKPEASSRWLGR